MSEGYGIKTAEVGEGSTGPQDRLTGAVECEKPASVLTSEDTADKSSQEQAETKASVLEADAPLALHATPEGPQHQHTTDSTSSTGQLHSVDESMATSSEIGALHDVPLHGVEAGAPDDVASQEVTSDSRPRELAEAFEESSGPAHVTGQLVEPVQAQESDLSAAEALAAPSTSRNTEAKTKDQPAVPSEEHSSNAPLDQERELPGPPTPSKQDSKLPETPRTGGSDEVEAVARAFGKSLHVSMEESTASASAAPSRSIDSSGAPSSAASNPATVPSPPARAGGLRIGKGPPPTTQASEEKPFDFNRFLDQMRHRSAGPVGEYVRSFIKGFTKKPYRVADQTKLILDFLDFIALRMRECEVWATLTAVDFENATEAMEKLVMNRLYNFTFSPAIKREGKWSVQTDDLERDRVLKQRIGLFGWITEDHLDVPIGDHSKGFVDFAIQELLKINHYKAPRDKVICILNCCKVIFGLIRHLSTQENADTFVPILIFVVLRANPDNLISNVEYISRFRNPERLSSESGYYLSSLMGAIAFIETMDYTSLSNITQQEFEVNVEAAVQTMSAQSEAVEEDRDDLGVGKGGLHVPLASPARSAKSSADAGGEMSSAQMTPQGSISSNEDGSRPPLPISAGAAALAKDTRAFIQRAGETARVGIGASLGGSMSALGRLFQDGIDGPRTPSGMSPSALPSSGRDTPEGVLGSSSEKGAGAPSSASARARMWNLFGVDEDQMNQQHVSRPKETLGGSSSSGPGPRPLSVNFGGSWSRAMRANDADSEPPTPQSEELRQGRFAPLHATSTAQAPLSERLARSFEVRTPRTPAPGQAVRQESIDPSYLVGGEGGVRTPTDDGSDVEDGSGGGALDPTGRRHPIAPDHGVRPAVTRSRRSDLSSYLPSFMTTPTPQAQHSLEQQQQGSAPHNVLGSPAQLPDDEAAHAAAQIDRAHVDAGVETLKSIFPDTDNGVCRLVLEGCHGDVQAAIDKLLEMS